MRTSQLPRPLPDPRGARPWGWALIAAPLCYLTQTNKSSGPPLPHFPSSLFSLPLPYSCTWQRGQVISVFLKLKAAAAAVAVAVMKTEERKKKRHLDCNRSVSVGQVDHPHCEWEKRSTRKWPSATRGEQGGVTGGNGAAEPMYKHETKRDHKTLQICGFQAAKTKQTQKEEATQNAARKQQKQNASNYFY